MNSIFEIYRKDGIIRVKTISETANYKFVEEALTSFVKATKENKNITSITFVFAHLSYEKKTPE